MIKASWAACAGALVFILSGAAGCGTQQATNPDDGAADDVPLDFPSEDFTADPDIIDMIEMDIIDVLDAVEIVEIDEAVDEAVEEEPPRPPTALEICADDNPGRIKACRNGSEICDDEGFSVPGGELVIACHANPAGDRGDGIGYIGLNSGPNCTQEEGCCPPGEGADCAVDLREFNGGTSSRCRGWEQCGCAEGGRVCPCEMPWDHLEYASDAGGDIIIDCTEEGTVREIDLSDHVGDGMYVGVYTQPDTTTGRMSTVCVAFKTW